MLKMDRPLDGAVSEAPHIQAQSSDVIYHLLKKSPDDLASWALRQVRSLSAPGVDVEQSEIFRLVCALSSVSAEQREILITNAFGGLRALPEDQKTETIRLAIPVLGAVEQLTNSPSSVTAQSSPLVENLERLAAEVARELPTAELAAMADSAHREAENLAQPEFMSAATALDDGERKQFTKVLVTSNLLPEEKREVVEGILTPGGLIDTLAAAFRWAAMVPKLNAVFLLLAIVELLIACLCCRSCPPLLVWLVVDSSISVATVVFAGLLAFSLRPIYNTFRTDVKGMAERWQLAANCGAGTGGRLQKAAPGVSPVLAIVCIVLEAILALVTLVWTVVGAVKFTTTGQACDSGPLVVCAVFVGLRMSVLMSLTLLTFKAVANFKQVQSAMDAPGPTSGYGTFQST